MEQSILTSVKKNLGIDAAYTAFDLDILTHINSAFSTLNQLGIGPEDGLTIESATTTWAAFVGSDAKLNSVRTYVYLKVRLLFDPPTTSYLIEAFERQIRELEWRLNSYREDTEWVPPTVPGANSDGVLDGGQP